MQRTKKRALSILLATVMALSMFTAVPMTALAAVSNQTVQDAITAKGYSSTATSIDISNDNSVMGTLNLDELKADFPDLTQLNVDNTNITNVVDSGSGITLSKTGTFADTNLTTRRSLIPPVNTLTYDLQANSATTPGIDLAALANALIVNNGDGTTISDLLTSSILANVLLNNTPIPAGGLSGLTLSDSFLRNTLGRGNYSLDIILSLKAVDPATNWAYTVSYTLSIGDEMVTPSPDSFTVYQGDTFYFDVIKKDSSGASVSLSTTDITLSDTFSGSLTNSTVSAGTAGALRVVYTLDPNEPPGSRSITVTDVSSGSSGKSFSIPVTVNPVTPITDPAIPGVTPPVAGATPVTAITETAQYTGTITWSPVPGASFGASTVYTATITLTPKAGYTLAGVAADFYTVAGATSVTNSANSGVITAVFPATSDPIVYNITAGGNGSWQKGTADGKQITCDGDFAKFIGVKVDGTWVDASNYTAVSGSTVITLKASYLQTLAVGTHTVEIHFTDGYATTTLNVLASNNPNVPQTGGYSTMMTWMIVLLLSALGMCSILVWRKRRQVYRT